MQLDRDKIESVLLNHGLSSTRSKALADILLDHDIFKDEKITKKTTKVVDKVEVFMEE